MSVMPKDKRGFERSRLGGWWHDNFDDWFFRSLIGPAQTKNAVHGADPATRELWLRDLERRKRYTQQQRELKRHTRENGHGN